MVFEGGADLDEVENMDDDDDEEDEDLGEISLVDALGDADMGGMEMEEKTTMEEKIKIKVKKSKVKSSLRKGDGMSMGM